MLDEEGYGVVYVMENRDTNRLYIGKHWCKPGVTYSFDEKMFSDGYRGSGVDWVQDRDSMDTPPDDIRLVCILGEYPTREQLAAAETRWIEYYSATTSLHFYNKQPYGGGGDIVSRLPKDKHDAFVAKQHELAIKLNYVSHFGDVSGVHNGMYGKHHTEHARQLNREKHLGKRYSEETKNKHRQISIARGFRPPNNAGKLRYTNEIYNIILLQDEAVPDGFRRGVTFGAPKLCAKCLKDIGHIKYRLCPACRK